jgi:hypothetical protein
MPAVVRSLIRASAGALGLIAIAFGCAACGGASSKAASAGDDGNGVPNAPFAAGSSAANLQLGPEGCSNARCTRRKRVMVRWVARHTGKIETLYLEFKSNIETPINCVSAANGYGGGTSGTALVQTYRVRPSGAPDYSHLLAEVTFNPCKAADNGSVPIPLGFKTTRGREFATVVRNVDPHPLRNYFSVNTLYDAAGIAGANGRNTRSAKATDVFYGLDPRELVVVSRNGGESWRFGGIDHLPTYIQRYADGFRAGQPYLYATCPCPGTVSGEATMVFPRVPHFWTIRQLGAYTVGDGAAQVDLLINGQVVRSANLSGKGMLRADIEPVTAEPGSTVSVRTQAGDRGLALQRIDADTPWKQGPVFTLGHHSRFYYLEQQGGGAAAQAAVTVYPLPMYPVGG